jgi:hypothetical protein
MLKSSLHVFMNLKLNLLIIPPSLVQEQFQWMLVIDIVYIRIRRMRDVS